MGTAFWMGAAIVGTMITDIEIRSLVIVSVFTVVTPSFWCDLDALPKDANELSAVLLGDIPNSSTMSEDMNER